MPALKKRKPHIAIQERDIVLFTSLFESRAMTSSHAETLCFDGRKESAKKRLQKLKKAGLIGAQKRYHLKPSVLFLTHKGLTQLQEHGILMNYPQLDLGTLAKRALVSDLTLRHELEVMDVKTAFYAALSSSALFSIAEFSTWPILHQFEVYSRFGGTQITVKPDGFIRITENSDGDRLSGNSFFMELDRSSETLDTLVKKAFSYVEYYKSGGFALKNGADRSAFKEHPFRVLFVVKSAERRNNLAERFLQNNPPILTQVCLSTLEEALANPLGDIWFSPVDYRHAITGSNFEVKCQYQRRYQRRVDRDMFIEKNIRKWKLLPGGYGN
jgi:hypothetical protein